MLFDMHNSACIAEKTPNCKGETMSTKAFTTATAVQNRNIGAVCDEREVEAALANLLGADMFTRSRRLSRLLRFLVEKHLAGAVRDTGEYAIGIAVFDRDPATYFTGEDPIVRVQVGRLREKLKAYYAGAGADAGLRFAIPVGSYMPTIARHSAAPAEAATDLLAVLPLSHSGDDPVAGAFARGLAEELGFQLFKGLGRKRVCYGTAAEASARLEGSVRVDGERIRATLRLVDALTGCIVWAGRFDRAAPNAIAVQEELATTVCRVLMPHLAQPAQAGALRIASA
jgi:TolB-like protein